MHWTPRREAFRKQIASDQCVYPGSVYDPISARIAEDLGFEVGMFAGSIASMTVLGAPDLIVLNQQEFADQAYRINRAGSLPLIVDADHGYGNALNVKRTVEELETAGVAALSIEDTLLPKRHDSGDRAELLSLEEGVGKMKAAVAGRQDSNLVILGRTSAMKLSSTEDAIKRAVAYQDAGVDMLFMIGVSGLDQLKALADAVSVPIMLGGASKDIMDRELLAAHGVRVCLQGHKPFAAAVQAVYSTLKALREGVAPADIEGTASGELMRQVTRADAYDQQTKDWL